MKNYLKKTVKWVGILTLVMISALLYRVNRVMADGYGLTMAPMKQNIVIDPGDSYRATFTISNPANSTQDTYYSIEVEPFYKDESGVVIYSEEGDHGEIVKWVTPSIPLTGKLAPNEVKEVIVKIDVPESAPAGGQYFAVNVTASAGPNDEDSDLIDISDGATIKEVKRMSHLVYAEITGATVKRGEITDVNLPSFLLSGKITGSSSIKNTGNVHGEAKYVLKVFPLFSDEPVYTNEENPATSTILPNRTSYHATSWDGTPGIGIFNVVYTVEFEGSKAEVLKMVIICPLWLLFVIIFIIVVIIMWLVVKAKSRKKKTATA